MIPSSRRRWGAFISFESLPSKWKWMKSLLVLNFVLLVKTHRHGENVKRCVASFIFADIIVMTVSFTHMQTDRKCTVPCQYGAEMPNASLTYRKRRGKKKNKQNENGALLGECTWWWWVCLARMTQQRTVTVNISSLLEKNVFTRSFPLTSSNEIAKTVMVSNLIAFSRDGRKYASFYHQFVFPNWVHIFPPA